jgi:hypothetical protein
VREKVQMADEFAAKPTNGGGNAVNAGNAISDAGSDYAKDIAATAR